MEPHGEIYIDQPGAYVEVDYSAVKLGLLGYPRDAVFDLVCMRFRGFRLSVNGCKRDSAMLMRVDMTELRNNRPRIQLIALHYRLLLRPICYFLHTCGR